MKDQQAPSIDPHIVQTYFFLRLGMGLLALVFPPSLWVIGHILPSHIPLQPSMSAYYHTDMRNEFVGMLWALGMFLFLYKGFSRREDWALNIAGVLAIGVAMLPTGTEFALGCNFDCGALGRECGCLIDRFKPFTYEPGHLACAVLFFIAIGYVAIFRSKDTLFLVKGRPSYSVYKNVYRILGTLMWALPIVAAGVAGFAHVAKIDHSDHTVYFLEFAAVWTFAAYWLVKTYELHETEGDTEVVQKRGSRRQKI